MILITSSDGKPAPSHCEDPREAVRVQLFETDAMRVAVGGGAQTIYVGGQSDMASWGQLPPSLGDCWEVDFDVGFGAYEIVLVGGGNPHHGILTVSVDGDIIEAVDQYAVSNTFPFESVVFWDGGNAPGRHTLRATVMGTNPRSQGARYWVCVHEVIFRPAPRRGLKVLTLHPAPMEEQTVEMVCTSISGEEVMIVTAPLDTQLLEVESAIAAGFDVGTCPPMRHEVSLVLSDGRRLESTEDRDTLRRLALFSNEGGKAQ